MNIFLLKKKKIKSLFNVFLHMVIDCYYLRVYAFYQKDPIIIMVFWMNLFVHFNLFLCSMIFQILMFMILVIFEDFRFHIKDPLFI